ncbi:hypothetical protein DSUL_50055 [Desulfovibrionales bacterium]
MVECNLAKVEVAGSSPVSRSSLYMSRYIYLTLLHIWTAIILLKNELAFIWNAIDVELWSSYALLKGP